MSLTAITSRHRVRHFRSAHAAGPGGGPLESNQELGRKLCTINPDSDFEAQEFNARNAQRNASIYFHFNPESHAGDFMQLVAQRIGNAWREITDGPIYRVESQLDFQIQNRLWRVRASERESLATEVV